MGETPSIDRLIGSATALTGPVAPWVAPLREAGRDQFARIGVPHRRLESWKYSDLSRALSKATGAVPATAEASKPGGLVATFVDGKLDLGKSTLPAEYVKSLAAELADPSSAFAGQIGRINPAEQADHPIVGLNTAGLMEGIVLALPKDNHLLAPLHLAFTWTGAEPTEGRHVRILVILDEGAKATLLETHTGTPGLSTVVTEIKAGPGAGLTHVRIERLGTPARQSAVTLGEFDSKAAYRGFYLSEGALFSRHEALLALTGEEADVSVDGIFLVAGSDHCDNTTIITHAAPNTSSRQAFRGVLGGEARAAYQGCVKVHAEAQKTDAYQMSRALLLSETAHIATKPELEIFADDVKCSHGATAGELDADALFFLRARGIDEAEARAMLVEAFLEEALSMIEADDLRQRARDAVTQWLSVHGSEVTHADE